MSGNSIVDIEPNVELGEVVNSLIVAKTNRKKLVASSHSATNYSAEVELAPVTNEEYLGGGVYHATPDQNVSTTESEKIPYRPLYPSVTEDINAMFNELVVEPDPLKVDHLPRSIVKFGSLTLPQDQKKVDNCLGINHTSILALALDANGEKGFDASYAARKEQHTDYQ